jgi:hypothetical protein
MKTDTATKAFLAMIMLGLWANVLIPVLIPAAKAQDSNYYLASIDSTLSAMMPAVMALGLSSTSPIESDLRSIESDLSRISRGLCLNSKLC